LAAGRLGGGGISWRSSRAASSIAAAIAGLHGGRDRRELFGIFVGSFHQEAADRQADLAARYGLFIVSCLFGLAYVVGGRSLWLPITVHGAAVLAIEVMRLYVVFDGPPWLLGYGEFPQSGLFGSLTVLAVAIGLVLLI
jgi:hypothetical protein